jgi:hypothetical protein
MSIKSQQAKIDKTDEIMGWAFLGFITLSILAVTITAFITI